MWGGGGLWFKSDRVSGRVCILPDLKYSQPLPSEQDLRHRISPSRKPPPPTPPLPAKKGRKKKKNKKTKTNQPKKPKFGLNEDDRNDQITTQQQSVTFPTTSLEIRTMAPATKFWHRVRHFHVPDLPPRYAPKFVTSQFPNALSQLRRKVRLARQESADPMAWKRPPPAFDQDVKHMKSWLQLASLPPHVFSFTHQPTFFLPAEPGELGFDASILKGPLRIAFPEPPGWTPGPWVPPEERELKYPMDPLKSRWDRVTIMVRRQDQPHPRIDNLEEGSTRTAPLASEATYCGPGILSIWPSVDFDEDTDTLGHNPATLERILTATTISVLEQQYGLRPFTVDNLPGIWVSSQHKSWGEDGSQLAQIATIYRHDLGEMCRFGVNIHVGQPALPMAALEDRREVRFNPWTRINQETTVTSIVAELTPENANRAAETQDTGGLLRYSWTKDDAGRELPFSLVHWMDDRWLRWKEGYGSWSYRKVPSDVPFFFHAPLGLDNYDLATAWAFEFAVQMGMKDGYLDQMTQAPKLKEIPVFARGRLRTLPHLCKVWDEYMESGEPWETLMKKSNTLLRRSLDGTRGGSGSWLKDTRVRAWKRGQERLEEKRRLEKSLRKAEKRRAKQMEKSMARDA